jgi:hypothetical protein
LTQRRKCVSLAIPRARAAPIRLQMDVHNAKMDIPLQLLLLRSVSIDAKTDNMRATQLVFPAILPFVQLALDQVQTNVRLAKVTTISLRLNVSSFVLFKSTLTL